MKKGDILKLLVISVGKNNDFLARHEGYTIFIKEPNPERTKDLGTKKIKGVILNSYLTVRVTKLFDKVAYAEAVK